MKESTRYVIATSVIALLVAELLFLGFQTLGRVKLFQLMHVPYRFLGHSGTLLILLASALAWFHEWAARMLVGLVLEVYRRIATFIMLAVIGAEGFMHIFSLPHLEGWWAPLLGSSAIATAVTAWFHRSKSNSSSSQQTSHNDR